MSADTVLGAGPLYDFAVGILEAAGVASERARLVADVLLFANLRGVDSHGVQLLPYYVEQLEAGDVDPAAEGRVVSETGGSMVYDGSNGLGAAISEICCAHANRLAREHGLALVVARESNHFGAAAFWARRLSAAGNIGIVMCNASPMVSPWQGREPRLGTNPICMSVPGPYENSWLLDMATTTVAAGKIYKAWFNGQPRIPHGWALDCEGRPTAETEAALKGSLMPLGGYKGSGLAMMAEILCAVLGGGAMSLELGGIRIRGKPMRCSQMFLAIDVARFMPLTGFQDRMGRLVAMLKSSVPAAGFDEVLVAGEPELRAEALRRSSGIPIQSGTWQALTTTAERWGVPLPTPA